VDPLLLEVLRFGTAILAGGLVAVIAQRIAFDHARQLQSEATSRHDDALRRALVSEIRENLRRLGGPTASRFPGAAIVRSAWDEARSLALPDRVFDAVATAYALGDVLSAEIGLYTARAASGGLVISRADEQTRNSLAREAIAARSQNAHDLFVKALEALGAHADAPQPETADKTTDAAEEA
jgi:hypothetical protein